MRVLLVGGCGFIGKALVAEMNRLGGYSVSVLDNESVCTRNNLIGLNIASFANGDVRDSGAVEKAMVGQDAVVLLAAQTNVIRSIEDPAADFDINIRGGLNVLLAAKQHGIKRFIFASSAAPVGVREPPMHEDMAPRPAAPYGVSKLAMEGYCSAFFQSYGLPTVSLRFSNVYGPGSVHKSSVVALFMRRIMAGQTLSIFGDGGQTRDFLYIDDLIHMIMAAINHPENSDAWGGVFQLGTGDETSIATLIDLLRPLVKSDGFDIKLQHEPTRAGEIIRNFADISRFVNTFGVRPQAVLNEGLTTTWDYFKALAAK